MELSLKFKDKEIMNTKNLSISKIGFIILNEIAFNVIIYIWYLLYSFGIITGPNPYFALVITFIQSLISFTYLLINGISQSNLIKYFIVLIIFKLLPIISMRNDIRVNYLDVYTCVYLYIIYIFILLVFVNLLFKQNIDVPDIITHDITNDKYANSINSHIYDTVYNDMILRII